MNRRQAAKYMRKFLDQIEAGQHQIPLWPDYITAFKMALRDLEGTADQLNVRSAPRNKRG